VILDAVNHDSYLLSDIELRRNRSQVAEILRQHTRGAGSARRGRSPHHPVAPRPHAGPRVPSWASGDRRTSWVPRDSLSRTVCNSISLEQPSWLTLLCQLRRDALGHGWRCSTQCGSGLGASCRARRTARSTASWARPCDRSRPALSAMWFEHSGYRSTPIGNSSSRLRFEITRFPAPAAPRRSEPRRGRPRSDWRFRRGLARRCRRPSRAPRWCGRSAGRGSRSPRGRRRPS
jgi:hypothetical protein